MKVLKRDVEEILRAVDEVKTHMSDPEYVKVCDTLKRVYEEAPEEEAVEETLRCECDHHDVVWDDDVRRELQTYDTPHPRLRARTCYARAVTTELRECRVKWMNECGLALLTVRSLSPKHPVLNLTEPLKQMLEEGDGFSELLFNTL